MLDHPQLVRHVVEVPEAREQIEYDVERPRSERLAHVAAHEPKIRPLAPPRYAYAFGRQVESCHVESFRRQVFRVPSGAAAKVEYRSVACRVETRNQAIDKNRGFVVVAVGVEPVIVEAVEPGREPLGLRLAGHCWRDHGRSPPETRRRLVHSRYRPARVGELIYIKK